MLKNYLKTAWRNLLRRKTFSAINILGLSLGLTCSILIFLWVRDERQITPFLQKGNTHAVYEWADFEGKANASLVTRGLLAEELKSKIPGIKYTTSFGSAAARLSTANEKSLYGKGCFADSDFFYVCRYQLLAGSAAYALNQSDQIALSETIGTTFFGNAKTAMGKTIRDNNLVDFRVSAVSQNLPSTPYEKLICPEWAICRKVDPSPKDWTYRYLRTFIVVQQNDTNTSHA